MWVSPSSGQLSNLAAVVGLAKQIFRFVLISEGASQHGHAGAQQISAATAVTSLQRDAACALGLASGFQLVCILQDKGAGHKCAAAQVLYVPADCQVPDIALNIMHGRVAGVAPTVESSE